VYLSLGVNELGIYKDKSFYSSYSAAIDQIRLVQPGAVIYIQGLIPVNEAQVEEHNGNKYNLSNDHLRVYNDLMRQRRSKWSIWTCTPNSRTRTAPCPRGSAGTAST
jgi:hypothetical protein